MHYRILIISKLFPPGHLMAVILYYCCAIKKILKKPDYESFMDVHSMITV